MNKHLLPKFIITTTVILTVLCFASLLFAQEQRAKVSLEDLTPVKQEQATKYRGLGLEYQRIGNLTEALTYYQKAAAIAPNLGIVYNDLGVVYEALGYLDQAELNYLKSIEIDPAYPGVYTNLALFYENQRNFKKAAFYWDKRVKLGVAGDPWTKKAVKRLADIRMSLSESPFSDSREEDVLSLMNDVAQDKTRLSPVNVDLAKNHFKKAKLSFERGDFTTALKEASDAQCLDQNNPEIKAFVEKAELRALTR